MLTFEQIELLNTIPIDTTVEISPYDPTAEEKFQKIKTHIQKALGKTIPVVHRGSSSLGILGQNEIDIYIPVIPEEMLLLKSALEKLFGKAKSVRPFQRIRYSTIVDSKHIDLFLINKYHTDWIEGTAFEERCRSCSKVLDAYIQLKEKMNGATMQEFYRQKTEFINGVLHENLS